LPLPQEAIARLLRFLEEEIADALTAKAADTFTIAEIEEVTGDPEVGGKLRRLREKTERIEAIRKAGLMELSSEELERVLDEARTPAVSGRS
jgi:hypothetical protein